MNADFNAAVLIVLVLLITYYCGAFDLCALTLRTTTTKRDTMTATPYTGPVRKNTSTAAVQTSTESEDFPRPEHSCFGRGGSVRKAGRLTAVEFLTPRPPYARKNADGDLLPSAEVEAMNQSITTPATSSTAVRVKAPRRTKPAVVRIAKPSGLSFHTRHTDARGNAVLGNAFDVPLERYDYGWDTGRRAAAELLAVLKTNPNNGEPAMGLRLSDLLPDVAKALAERTHGDTPARKGAALGFLSVLDAAIKFAVHNADMQGYVQRELDRSESYRVREVERKAAERVEFVQRMQAARKTKREVTGVTV